MRLEPPHRCRNTFFLWNDFFCQAYLLPTKSLTSDALTAKNAVLTLHIPAVVRIAAPQEV